MTTQSSEGLMTNLVITERPEGWRAVAPLDGCTFSGYECSDKGHARSIDRKQGNRQLRGKVLGCHCKPLPCHGDYLAALANATGGALRPIRVAWTNLVACFPLHAKREGSNEPSKGQILACQPRLAEFIEELV